MVLGTLHGLAWSLPGACHITGLAWCSAHYAVESTGEMDCVLTEELRVWAHDELHVYATETDSLLGGSMRASERLAMFRHAGLACRPRMQDSHAGLACRPRMKYSHAGLACRPGNGSVDGVREHFCVV